MDDRNFWNKRNHLGFWTYCKFQQPIPSQKFLSQIPPGIEQWAESPIHSGCHCSQSFRPALYFICFYIILCIGPWWLQQSPLYWFPSLSLQAWLQSSLLLSFIPLGSYRILIFFILRSQLLHIAVEGSCVCPHLPNCLNSKLSDTSSDRSSHTQQSSWQGSPHCAEMQLPRQMYAFILSPYFKITLWEDTERYIKCSFCDRSCIPSCWKW